MKRFVIIVSVLLMLFMSDIFAQQLTSFEQAVELAKKQDKPLLLEFVREDCEFCEKARDDFETNATIKQVLENVVHYPVNLLTDEGKRLDKKYKAGVSFPVFILANSEGDAIVRWSGYSQPHRFMNALKDALEDQTTIKTRLARVRQNPSYADSYFLANYFAQMEEHMAAVAYYKQAQELGGAHNANFEFEIFLNTADAAWKDQVPLDTVYPAAERFVAAHGKTQEEVARMAMGLSRLARKYNNTENLEKYLDYALKSLKQTNTVNLTRMRMLLLSEHALLIKGDTVAAIEIQKSSLGDGWENNPPRYYRFVRWCLEREINLEEAEMYARKAVESAPEGEFKAGVYKTLAEVCYARGKLDEAVIAIENAIDIDAGNHEYMNLWEKYVAELEDKGKNQ